MKVLVLTALLCLVSCDAAACDKKKGAYPSEHNPDLGDMQGDQVCDGKKFPNRMCQSGAKCLEDGCCYSTCKGGFICSRTGPTPLGCTSKGVCGLCEENSQCEEGLACNPETKLCDMLAKDADKPADNPNGGNGGSSGGSSGSSGGNNNNNNNNHEKSKDAAVSIKVGALVGIACLAGHASL